MGQASSFSEAGAVDDEDQRLIHAAGEGNLDTVKELLSEGVAVNSKSPAGETPLHVAGIFCAEGVVDALLAARANVNVATNAGQGMSMTPLHWYVNMNPCKLHHVRLLLEARADQNAKNTQGMTPLDMVSMIEGRQHIAGLLRDPLGSHAEPAVHDTAPPTRSKSDQGEL